MHMKKIKKVSLVLPCKASAHKPSPNQPGSTTIKLSWIQQTSAKNILEFARSNDSASLADDLPSLLECMYIKFLLNIVLLLNCTSLASSLVAGPSSTDVMERRGYIVYV